MKHSVSRIRLLLLVVCLPFGALAQLNNGGLYAGFGVDADTRTNFLKFGALTGAIASDDWFAPSGTGYNVIDTSNSAAWLALLQGSANLQFSQRMSQLIYAKVNGKLWLDAAYGRDFSAASKLKDSTVFSIAAKNGDDPNTWQGGIAGTPAKNDLIDVYAHMRRDGTTVYDSLWFFTGIVAFGNAANSYYNVELYKKSFSYSGTTNTFSSAGTSGGHTEWLFDATGNLIQTGDMIVAVSFAPGSVPVIEVRIWVSQLTYNNWSGATTPKYFNFNNYSAGVGSYGYASIVSKTGTTAFGGGVANYTGNPSNDSTYSTPWGTTNSVTGWSDMYQPSQYIEVGLNLTRIGVDPALYSALSPCQSMFSNIFFASRSSSSFSANLQDFVTPLAFLRQPLADFAVTGDTLRCNHTAGILKASSATTAGTYTWKTLGGATITGSNSDSTQLNISKPGTYIVSASPATGCPSTVVDTIVVPIDTFPPVATAMAGMANYQLHFYGGNPVASNYPTPFGGSQGLDYKWTGPNSFTSGLQNPVTDTVWGTYDITVTEKRNGCTATAAVTVTSSMFTILVSDAIQLHGVARAQQIDLSWTDPDQNLNASYIVERSDGVHDFQAMDTVSNAAAGKGTSVAGTFAFTDAHPVNGNNLYRIGVVSVSGDLHYSPTITISSGSASPTAIYLATQVASGPTLVVTTQQAANGVLVQYDLTGRVLGKKMLSFGPGVNSIPVADGGAAGQPRVNVFALYMGGQVAWCQKVAL